ncbi:hypothetical protein Bca4012_038179 [Brassica carinata]
MENESGYGSEPGYRGNVEFGYDDEYYDEEEDVKLFAVFALLVYSVFALLLLVTLKSLNELDAAPSLSQKHQQIAKMEEDSVKEKIIVCSAAKAFRGSKKDRSIAEWRYLCWVISELHE